MTNEQDNQHMQELVAAYRFTVENLRARVVELEAKLTAAPQGVQPKGEWTREVVQGSVVIRHPYGDSYEFPISTLAGYFTHPTQQGLDALDAARYRWLRERDLETVHKGGVFAGMTPENYVINGVDLDAAIDAAIAAQAKQGGV